MSRHSATRTSQNGAPPSFDNADNLRQKARAAGLHPDYWYAVEYDAAIKPGEVKEVHFWNRSIALFRGQDGTLTALENRCSHRRLKLSLGDVNGCDLVCLYHGWRYNRQGEVIDFSHELFGRPKPPTVPTYPLKVRYGLIWLFPGDPTLIENRTIPDIPELEGNDPWPCVPVDFIWPAHHSIIMENTCDFTHAYLHRRYRPFEDAKLTKSKIHGERIFASYDATAGHGRFSRYFADQTAINTNQMDLCYEYPYQWSNTGDRIKHWCFLLPMNERVTRVFFLFYFSKFKIPFTPLRIPQNLMRLFLKGAKRMHIQPLLAQTGVAVTAEQIGYEQHHDSPPIERNPAIHQFQELTIRKWEEHVAKAVESSGSAAWFHCKF
jgi:nitrite reductase/ring-hydroxylating ferredoxin subunit